ncbi:MAG: glutathione ABC transporter substrate-binding protein GsiB [Acetobacteraceae bacterium]
MSTFHRLAFAASLAAAAPCWAAGNLTVAMDANLAGLDPYDLNDNASLSAGRLMFQGLFGFDKDMHVIPVLAESFDASEDATEFTIRLRHGVTFQDGTPFNAAAVKISFERLVDPANHLKRASLLSMLGHIDVVDEFTIRLVLKTPFGALIPTLAHPAMVIHSPKALASFGAELARHPTGTGPFEFVSWTPDTLKVKRFEHYWKPGLPHVDTVTVRGVPENGTRIASLQAGETQFIYPVPSEMLPVVSRDTRFKVVNEPSIFARYASMNVMKKPFDDVRVRQALNYAVDKAAYVKVVFNGTAEPLRSAIPAKLGFYKEQGEYAYDPAKAKQLLAEAGYPTGFETTLWANTSTVALRSMQFLQQQLAVVGVKVNVQPLEAGVLTQRIYSVQKPEDAEVAMYAGAWSSSTGDADWGMRPLFSRMGFPPTLYNTAYYASPEVDKDIAEALATADAAKRGVAYAAAQAQIWKDAPWIFLCVENILAAQSAKLSGVYRIADGTMLMEEAELH